MIISVVIVIVSISDFGSNPWALYQPSFCDGNPGSFKNSLQMLPRADVSKPISLPFITIHLGSILVFTTIPGFFSTPSHISYEELLGCPSRHLEACQIIRYEAGIDTTIMDVLNKSCIGTHAIPCIHIQSYTLWLCQNSY